MKSMFKRREVFGAIVAVAVVLVLGACAGTTPGTLQVTANLADIEFPAGDMAARTVDLSKHFSTSRQSLTFEADSSMKAYVTAAVSGSTLTVTPVAAGSSTVTVTADDGNEEKSRSFTVTVMAPPPTPKPEITATIPTPITFMSVDAAPHSRPLSLFFSGAASYVITTEPMEQEVVGWALTDGVLTISPMGVGHAVVIITAVNAGGSVSQTIVVSVGAPPTPPPTAVTLVSNIASQRFPHDDMAARMFTLSDHFAGAATYMTSSTDDAVAMAAEAGGVLTVTPGIPGDAEVSVTGTSADNLSLTLTFHVTVDAPPEPPKPPMLKMGKMIPSAVKITAIPDDRDTILVGGTAVGTFDPNTATHTAAFDSAAKRYVLSDLIGDPEGPDADLVFSTTTSDPKVVAAYPTPDTDVYANPDAGVLDKMMTDASSITVRGRKAGTATVTITATGDSGVPASWTIMVTVAPSNAGPSRQIESGTSSGQFPGEVAATNDYNAFAILADTGRLKSDASMWKQKLDFGAIFDDPNIEDDGALRTGLDSDNTRTSNDSWTFSAKSSKEDVVTVSLGPTNNAEKPDERYVMITRVGSGDSEITLTVTDSFGMTAEHTFMVKVNSAPVPYNGDDDDRRSLSTENRLMQLVAATDAADVDIGGDASTDDFAITDGVVTLVDDDFDADPMKGYFSDKDGDSLACRINPTGESVEVTLAANRQSITIDPVATKTGQTTVEVTCWDQVDGNNFESAMDTLTMNVAFQQSISN